MTCMHAASEDDMHACMQANKSINVNGPDSGWMAVRSRLYINIIARHCSSHFMIQPRTRPRTVLYSFIHSFIHHSMIDDDIARSSPHTITPIPYFLRAADDIMPASHVFINNNDELRGRHLLSFVHIYSSVSSCYIQANYTCIVTYIHIQEVCIPLSSIIKQ